MNDLQIDALYEDLFWISEYPNRVDDPNEDALELAGRARNALVMFEGFAASLEPRA